jgi:hypothetical protein
MAKVLLSVLLVTEINANQEVTYDKGKSKVYSNSKYLADFQTDMNLDKCEHYCSNWKNVCKDMCKEKKKCGLSDDVDARHFTRETSCEKECTGFNMHEDGHCTLFAENVQLRHGGRGQFYNAVEPSEPSEKSGPMGFQFANPMSMPWSFTAMCCMFLFHGFLIDVIAINTLPHFGSSPMRGWEPSTEPEKAPTQRRFMAENLAYALLRLSPMLFIKTMPVYLLCTISYLLEGGSICWEINFYNGTKDALPPATLMCIFSTWVMLTVYFNQGDFISNVYPDIFMVMHVSVGLTWLAWIMSLIGLSKKPSDRELVPTK